jgi:hypothetical protein
MNQRKCLRKVKHFVLIGPAAKQSGRLDQRDLALQFAAIKKSRAGFAGGIIDLLLPRTNKEWKTVARLSSKGYLVKEVNTRPSIRSKVRDAVICDSLFAQLANRFHDENRNSPRAMGAPVREFSVWITKKIREKDSYIVQLLSRSQPELPNRVEADWWKVQIKLRRKKVKK